ncbi:hypothetical protein N7G274_000152 [Stereocaulon virgatum]|uniref:Uncharacterized protein n=1 Tax=Stereocaulon virgatum TaxID=373712 RepID=A0ABR4AU27_9LECA
MKAISQQEFFLQVEEGDDDDFKLSHISFLFQDGINLYKERSLKRIVRDFDIIDLSELKMQHAPTPVEHYRPLLYDKSTVAPAPSPEGCYQKFPNLVAYNTSNPTLLSRILLHEAQIRDLLASKLNPNVATYQSRIIEDSRIAGLCFTRDS